MNHSYKLLFLLLFSAGMAPAQQFFDPNEVKTVSLGEEKDLFFQIGFHKSFGFNSFSISHETIIGSDVSTIDFSLGGGMGFSGGVVYDMNDRFALSADASIYQILSIQSETNSIGSSTETITSRANGLRMQVFSKANLRFRSEWGAYEQLHYLGAGPGLIYMNEVKVLEGRPYTEFELELSPEPTFGLELSYRQYWRLNTNLWLGGMLAYRHASTAFEINTNSSDEALDPIGYAGLIQKFDSEQDGTSLSGLDFSASLLF